MYCGLCVMIWCVYKWDLYWLLLNRCVNVCCALRKLTRVFSYFTSFCVVVTRREMAAVVCGLPLDHCFILLCLAGTSWN